MAGIFLHLSVLSQSNSSGRFQDGLESKSFVKNQGQFDQRLPAEGIQFGYEGDGQQVFLAGQKVYFNLYEAKLHEKTESEKAQRAARKKKGFDTPEAFTAFEKAGKRFDYSTDLLTAEWIGANPDVQLIPSEKDPFTHSYEYRNGVRYASRNEVPSYQKITYQNLYPFIDVEYTLHPESGIKYSLILHPGADLSQVKLRYSKSPVLNPDGSISTPTRFGEVTDHPPVTFYQDSKTAISSAYRLQGNEISFVLAGYDASQIVVIDPWTDLPNDPGSNWNCAWECETDALGNSYAIFGAMPMRLRKYNALGAIQWTYNTTYDTTAWLGTFVTDDLGNSYVTNGSVAALRKVSPAGGLIWSVGNITGQLLGEFWNIAFNCDQTKLVVGGTGGVFLPEPYIFDVNPANGALLGSVLIHQGTGLFSPSEVRGITATENGKYYWLTHDSIGFLSESFANCPLPGPELIAHSTYGLGYKCENWRYNNTGIEAMAYYGGFVFVNRGNRIDKRDFATAAIVTSATIPGGAFTSQFGGNFVQNSGIVIDNNGRIFVGSRGSVSEFNVNLNLIATTPVTGGYNVYDVDLTSTGELIACGATGTSSSNSRTGTVESLGILGAGPFAMTCCDASICQVGPLCDDGSPVTLTAAVGGGTWSSSAPGFNAATGVFDPSVAGIGTYTFYNTVACGVDSLVIDVVFCPGLSICRETNGDLTVTGGTGPYTWEEGTMVASCPFGPGAGCNFLTHAVNTLTWTQFGTGVTVTPPPGADSVRVLDGSLEGLSWDISSLPFCTILPVELLAFAGESVRPGSNRLEWVTASESNSDHFTLQHSGNGTDWKFIGTVPAAGNTDIESEYNFIDDKAFAPITWYRLGEKSSNGEFRHLSTIAVSSSSDDNLILDLHPNPATETVYFTFSGSKSTLDPLELSIVNSLGVVVKEVTWTDTPHNSLLDFRVSELSPGVYEMCFKQGMRSAYHKVLILR
jgi:hypothetical protein